VLYLFDGFRRPARRSRALLFAGFSFAYAGASLTARSAFLSDSTAAYVSSLRISFIFASAAFGFLGWYVYHYSSFGSRWLLWAFTTAWSLIAATLVFAPDLVLGSGIDTGTITMPWGEEIRTAGEDRSPWLALGAFLQLVLVGYVAVAATAQYRRGKRAEALALAVGIGWFAGALVLEVLSTFGSSNIPPLADFGYLGFLFSLSFARVKQASDVERELVRNQEILELRVAERTAELAGAQQSLVDQARETAAEAERVRISRDLHDAVSQLLFSINLIAGSLPRLWQSDPEAAERTTTEIQRLARGALAEMRTLLRELRPHTIRQTELSLLIEQLTQGVAARMDVPFDNEVSIDGDLPEEVHVAAYRICQEAIANVAKHADANRITVRVHGGPSYLHLSVTDDGMGFDETARPSGTIGLSTMAERASSAGGTVQVVSQPGAGTVVTFEWEHSNG